jgi:hypothetical protein
MTQETSPNIARKQCKVCALCSQNQKIDDLVHREKLETRMSIKKLRKRIFEEYGEKIGEASLSRHYKKHLPPDKLKLYQEQARSLSTKIANQTSGPKTPKVRYKSVNHLGKLRSMHIFYGGELSRLRKLAEAGTLDKNNQQAMDHALAQFIQLGREIRDMEQTDSALAELIRGKYEKIFKDLSRELFAILGEFCELDDDTRAQVAQRLLVVFEKGIDTAVDEFGRER